MTGFSRVAAPVRIAARSPHPLLAQAVDRRDHHDAVQDRDAEEGDEADRRREVQVQAAQPERRDAADERERARSG